MKTKLKLVALSRNELKRTTGLAALSCADGSGGTGSCAMGNSPEPDTEPGGDTGDNGGDTGCACACYSPDPKDEVSLMNNSMANGEYVA